ncbi:MAG: hypothetical protein AAF558_00720 [Verrucomicrobiota bacterium]
MSRRARSRFSPLHVILGLGFLGILMLAAYFFVQTEDTSFRTLPELQVEAYLENANSLRGNTYKLEGVINHSLAWSSSFGRLFSVQVDQSRDEYLVPVLIPADLNDTNIQRGQKFVMKIEVVENGLLRVLEMDKS